MENLIKYEWFLYLIAFTWMCIMPYSFYNALTKIARFIWKFALFLIAWLLIPFLTLINFCMVWDEGYFLDTALSLDIWGNREFRKLWNATLIKPNGYQFGIQGETISSVLGKNQWNGTLTTTGKALAFILDTIDKRHCYKSINHQFNW